MQIVRLEAENFKRLQAVEITPEGHVVQIGGKNGSGKSSVLDAIYVALVGRSAAPPKPVRNGEEKCTIKLDMGELVVTRTFTVKDGGSFTDTLKVENSEGLRYGSPQGVLDALLGEIGFDPFEFVQMKPDKQAETLLAMVPLTIDLDEYAELDTSDYAKRRDINRDAAALKAQVQAIPAEETPKDLPDRQALQDKLANAADTNTQIERRRLDREQTKAHVTSALAEAEQHRSRAAELRKQAEEQDRLAESKEDWAKNNQEALDNAEPLPEPVDVAQLRTLLQSADEEIAKVERQQRRARLAEQLAKLEAESEALTKAMEDREAARQEALKAADMPIDGLAFGTDEKGKPVVTFNGVPFEQASTAEQLRASTAIAMRANPQLRVLRIKDGSLLDDDSMKLLADLAGAEDFQLWIERVGTGGVGIIMENGAVAKAEPKAKAAKAEAKEPEKLL